MRKRIGYILLIAGGLFIAPMFWALISFAVTLISPNKSIGIIGGADEPTAVFLISMCLGHDLLWGIILLVIGIVCLIASAVLLKENKSQ